MHTADTSPMPITAGDDASVHRRDFFQQSARTLAGATAGLTILSRKAAEAAPSERLHLAVMGLHGRGRSLALGFAGQEDVRITHLCDIDSNLLPAVAQAVGQKQA